MYMKETCFIENDVSLVSSNFQIFKSSRLNNYMNTRSFRHNFIQTVILIRPKRTISNTKNNEKSLIPGIVIIGITLSITTMPSLSLLSTLQLLCFLSHVVFSTPRGTLLRHRSLELDNVFRQQQPHMTFSSNTLLALLLTRPTRRARKSVKSSPSPRAN